MFHSAQQLSRWRVISQACPAARCRQSVLPPQKRYRSDPSTTLTPNEPSHPISQQDALPSAIDVEPIHAQTGPDATERQDSTQLRRPPPLHRISTRKKSRASPPKKPSTNSDNAVENNTKEPLLRKVKGPRVATNQESLKRDTRNVCDEAGRHSYQPLRRSPITQGIRSAPRPVNRLNVPANRLRRSVRLHVPALVHQTRKITAAEFEVHPIDVVQPPVPRLAHGLDRVLFNRGVYHLQDNRSLVYNFDPSLERVMPVEDFDFDALQTYKTSSEDHALANLAKARGKKYVGSTSSMTTTLAQFHHLLSHFRLINTDMLSSAFNVDSRAYTRIMRAPSSIFLRWRDGTYAIDADKEVDEPNILMLLGRSVEKMLIMSEAEYKRYRRTSADGPSEQDAEAFQYTEMGDLLMRSQLDAYDPRLPGRGTFDLKTRCVKSIRHDMDSPKSLGYELRQLHGQYQSFEREYFDMLRATLMKYMLQARMGRMDGIFVAYHNIERIFGFQYLSMEEIDFAIHNQVTTDVGSAEFNMSLGMLNDVLNRATERFPQQSLRLTFYTDGTYAGDECVLRVFAEPVEDSEIDAIQNASKEKSAAFQKKLFDSSLIEDDSETSAVDLSTDSFSENTDRASLAADHPVEVEIDDYAQHAPVNEVPLSEARRVESAAASAATDDDNVDTVATDDQLTEPATNTTTDAADLPPLLAIEITTRSFIKKTPYIRVPDRISPKLAAHWNVDYTVAEYAADQLGAAWNLYRDTRRNRKSALAASRATGLDSEGEELAPDAYRENLRRLAREGRLYRQRRSAQFRDRPLRVLDS